MRHALLLILALLLLAGCSNTRFSVTREIGEFRLLSSIQMPGNYDKAVSDSRGGVVFAMAKASQEIDIFRNGLRVNSIGGLGFDRTNFQRLGDIGVDADGGLLALDTSQKLLRKFSPGGEYMGQLQFASLRQPELFCIGGDGTLFIYDAATGEIICFSRLDSSELYRFGRFELDQPVWIACNRDYLYAYSAVKQSTHVFYLLGQYKETLPGQVLFDPFNNVVAAEALHPGYQDRPPNMMSINSDVISLLFDAEIRLYRIFYGRGADATP